MSPVYVNVGDFRWFPRPESQINCAGKCTSGAFSITNRTESRADRCQPAGLRGRRGSRCWL
jgi:hypothetical protein